MAGLWEAEFSLIFRKLTWQLPIVISSSHSSRVSIGQFKWKPPKVVKKMSQSCHKFIKNFVQQWHSAQHFKQSNKVNAIFFSPQVHVRLLMRKMDEHLYNHFEAHGMGDMLFVHRYDSHDDWRGKLSDFRVMMLSTWAVEKKAKKNSDLIWIWICDLVITGAMYYPVRYQVPWWVSNQYRIVEARWSSG